MSRRVQSLARELRAWIWCATLAADLRELRFGQLLMQGGRVGARQADGVGVDSRASSGHLHPLLPGFASQRQPVRAVLAVPSSARPVKPPRLHDDGLSSARSWSVVGH